jgi:hypothetical protein
MRDSLLSLPIACVARFGGLWCADGVGKLQVGIAAAGRDYRYIDAWAARPETSAEERDRLPGLGILPGSGRSGVVAGAADIARANCAQSGLKAMRTLRASEG